MTDQLASTKENLQRILAVQSCFGPNGMPLKKPGRVLVGEGHMMKLCRRRPEPRVFFLFNDILVYGSILVHGRLYTSQQVIQLENIVVEGLEDSPDMKNQFLIRAPRKSFYVSAASPQEKHAWVSHIKDCRAKRLKGKNQALVRSVAPSWIPDSASSICMRCCGKFTITNRRHHCRECGYLVCGPCSNKRFLIPNIKQNPVRVCRVCFTGAQARRQSEGNSAGNELVKGPTFQQWLEQQNRVRHASRPTVANKPTKNHSLNANEAKKKGSAVLVKLRSKEGSG